MDLIPVTDRMFEGLKATIQDLLKGNVAPADRRAAIMDMKRALVSARLGVEDLRESVEITRRKLTTERDQLATVQRRRELATGINDLETIALAEKYEQQYGDRVAMLEKKLDAQEAEASLAERELEEMMTALKAANAGVGSGLPPQSQGPTDADLGLPDDARLNSELGGMARARARADADASAEARLAELKKKMGQ